MPHVQRIGDAANASSGTVLVIPVVNSPAVGNHILVRYSGSEGGIVAGLSVTDDVGNVYQQDATLQRSGVQAFVFSALVETVPTEITLTLTNARGNRVAAAEEFSGWDEFDWLDAAANNDSFSDSPSISSATVVAEVDLVVVVGWFGETTTLTHDAAYPTDLGTVPASGTNRRNSGAVRGVADQDTYSYAGSLSTAHNWAAFQVSYKLEEEPTGVTFDAELATEANAASDVSLAPEPVFTAEPATEVNQAIDALFGPVTGMDAEPAIEVTRALDALFGPEPSFLVEPAVEINEALDVLFGPGEPEPEESEPKPGFRTPRPPRKRVIPRVAWTIDDRHVPVADWLATTKIGAGDDAFSGKTPERFATKFSSSFEQGSMVRAYRESGSVIWEGRMARDPARDESGYLNLSASGHYKELENAQDRLTFQTRDISLFQAEEGSPMEAVPSSKIKAQTINGGAIFSVETGESVAVGEEHHVGLTLEGSVARRAACRVRITGSNAARYDIRVFKAAGPKGGRTQVTTFALADNVTRDTGVISAPQDTLFIGLHCNVDDPDRTDPLQVIIQELRVNGRDGPAGDFFTASAVVARVGRLHGFDTTGIPVGGIGPAPRSEVNYIWGPVESEPLVVAEHHGALHFGTITMGTHFFRELKRIEVAEPAVAYSALNVLPLDWQSSHAALLDLMAAMEDYQWAAGRETPNGVPLIFAPWGKTHGINTASKGTRVLDSPEVYNQVVAHYTDAGGAPQTLRVKAMGDDDPLGRFGIVNSYELSLPNVQIDSKLVSSVARTVLEELRHRRKAGRIEIFDAADEGTDLYAIRSGAMVTDPEASPEALRVVSTEMSARGNVLGIDSHSSIAGLMAAVERIAVRGHGHAGFKGLAPTGNVRAPTVRP